MKKEKVSIKLKGLKKYVKNRKKILSRKYNKELKKVLEQRGYFKEEIEAAMKYSLPRKGVEIALAKVEVRKYSRDRKKAYVAKKGWIKVDTLNRSLRMKVYHARLKTYRDLLGIGHKEAQELYRQLRFKKTKEIFEIRKYIY